jgi:hypothetical protein
MRETLCHSQYAIPGSSQHTLRQANEASEPDVAAGGISDGMCVRRLLLGFFRCVLIPLNGIFWALAFSPIIIIYILRCIFNGFKVQIQTLPLR